MKEGASGAGQPARRGHSLPGRIRSRQEMGRKREEPRITRIRKEEATPRDRNTGHAFAGRIMLAFPIIRVDSCYSWFPLRRAVNGCAGAVLWRQASATMRRFEVRGPNAAKAAMKTELRSWANGADCRERSLWRSAGQRNGTEPVPYRDPRATERDGARSLQRVSRSHKTVAAASHETAMEHCPCSCVGRSDRQWLQRRP